MSWHPYERNSRLWTVYWQQSPVSIDPAGLWQFELTEPYCLNRDEWRDVQLRLLQNLAPADHTLNISQLWWRNWPTQASEHYTRLAEVFQLPITSSQECYRQELLERNEGYYWVITEAPPKNEVLNELLWHHGVDFENITWITPKPIQPFPGQLFEYNKAALGWHNKEISDAELNEIVCRESWGLAVVDVSHVLLRLPLKSISEKQIWAMLNQLAAEFQLELSPTKYEERPPRPNIIAGLLQACSDLTLTGWDKVSRLVKKA